MNFNVSQVVNKFLKDAAIIADKNNDGVVSSGEELSIFMKKSDMLIRAGVVTEEDYASVKDILSDSVSITGENFATAESDKLRYQKEIEINLAIHKNKLKKLEKSKPEDKFEKRTKIFESVAGSGIGVAGMFGGAFATAKLGALAGTSAGPVGIAFGALAGGIVGLGIGIYSGRKLGTSLISKDELKSSEQQRANEIEEEIKIIQNLENSLKNL